MTISQDQFNVHVYTPGKTSGFDTNQTVDFFYNHLDQYRDDRDSIQSSIDYALSDEPNKGGQVIVAYDGDQIAGAVIMNLTHMTGYHPPNYLVYIAVDQGYRGKGLGKLLMETTNEVTEGGIALHVEHDNPARHLYEKYGYTNKYLEYRLDK